MAFEPGKSGNPGGRPKGSRNKATKIRELIEPHAEALIGKAVEMALAGDSSAMRLLLDRLIPAYRPTDRSTEVSLPAADLTTPEGLMRAGQDVLEAVSAGMLSPGQARELTAALESQRRVVESADLDRRLAKLERMGGGGIQRSKSLQRRGVA